MGKPTKRRLLLVTATTIVLASCTQATPPASRPVSGGVADPLPTASSQDPLSAASSEIDATAEPTEAADNVAEASASEVQSVVASEAAVSVPVPERLATWQSKLAQGFKVEAEKVVGGFGYAFARPLNDVDGEAIIVSEHGETAGPFGTRSVGFDGLEVRAPALAMMDTGDLDGDGSTDLLMTWSEGCGIFLNRLTGPVQAWRWNKGGGCYVAEANGKPAVFFEVVPTGPNSDEYPTTYRMLVWAGKGFSAASVPALPAVRRPAPAMAPFSGTCTGLDDHGSDDEEPGYGISWYVSGRVLAGKLVSVDVSAAYSRCSTVVEHIDLEMGKEKTVPVTWELPSFEPDTPPKRKRGTLKVGIIRNDALVVRGRLCGDRPVQTTVARCKWVGPDDIALRE